jgi:hypothetical protein
MIVDRFADMQATHRFCGLCGSAMAERKQLVGKRFDRLTGKRDAQQHVFWRCANWSEPHPLTEDDERHDSEYMGTEKE